MKEFQVGENLPVAVDLVAYAARMYDMAWREEPFLPLPHEKDSYPTNWSWALQDRGKPIFLPLAGEVALFFWDSPRQQWNWTTGDMRSEEIKPLTIWDVRQLMFVLDQAAVGRHVSLPGGRSFRQLIPIELTLRPVNDRDRYSSVKLRLKNMARAKEQPHEDWDLPF